MTVKSNTSIKINLRIHTQKKKKSRLDEYEATLLRKQIQDTFSFKLVNFPASFQIFMAFYLAELREREREREREARLLDHQHNDTFHYILLYMHIQLDYDFYPKSI